MNTFKSFLSRIKVEHILIFVLLEISAIAHGYNMFNFPYYENDEGTYMSQAWSVVTQGELAPYTYWYDHAPLGWFFIGLWTLVTGGFFTFGMSVNSGRVFMLVLQVVSSFFLYAITKKVTGSKLGGIIAVLLFSLSPLAIYFHRRVLLDNIMVFWLLASFYVLTVKRLRITTIVFSALLFGIAILTKESAVFFIPAMIMILVVQLKAEQRIFSIVQWVAIVASIVSVYILYAVLKGEFFASGSLLGGSGQHVSLLETLKFQAARGNGAPLWDLGRNQFVHEVTQWFKQDAFLIVSGGIAVVSMIFVSFKKRQYLPFVVAALGYLFYLARGGNIIEFYVLPLIPIIALLVGGVVCEASRLVLSLLSLKSNSFKLQYAMYGITTLAMVVGISYYYANFGMMNRGHNIYTANQTKAQIEAVAWIREHVNPETVFTFDNYAHIDLKSTQNPSGVYFPQAQWYLKVDSDPEVRYDALGGTAASISMIAMTPQTHYDIEHNELNFLKSAADQSDKVKVFWSEGWGVEIWETKFPAHLMARSWDSYKKSFITQDGRTIDLEHSYETSSEMQAYSMLRAVWIDDKETFDLLWSWSEKNLQKENKLFAGLWGELQNGEWGVEATASRSSADVDSALALILASTKWNDASYLEDSKQIVQAIRTHEIASGKYVLAGDAQSQKDIVVHVPSLSPYAYRAFASVDTGYDWNGVLTTTYDMLAGCSSLSSVYISPEWCSVDTKTKLAYREAQGDNSGRIVRSSQIPWKLALDYVWSKDARALEYLKKGSFYKDEYSRSGKVFTEYSLSGKPTSNWESVAGYAGALGSLSVADKSQLDKLYTNKILTSYYYDDPGYVYWEDPDNVSVQNWGWLMVGLYDNKLFQPTFAAQTASAQ